MGLRGPLPERVAVPAGELQEGGLVVCSSGRQERLERIDRFEKDVEVVEVMFDPDAAVEAFLPESLICSRGVMPAHRHPCKPCFKLLRGFCLRRGSSCGFCHAPHPEVPDYAN